MGVCFNENGTSKCTSGTNYICISVLRVTQGSFCHMRPVYKGSSDQAPVVQKLDSAIHWINHYPVDKCYSPGKSGQEVKMLATECLFSHFVLLRHVY